MRLRAFLDEGGLVYRKLGQYLAMRFDLLPAEICTQLDRLFEGAEPMPFPEVLHRIDAELQRPWQQCFSYIDPHPLGSASVAQVHPALSLRGERLALKVQRSHIQRQLESDTRIMRMLAKSADFLSLTGPISVDELVSEFLQFTQRELDFVAEGVAAERLQQGMSPHGYVPRIYWEFTTPRLLTMELIEGESFLSICNLHESGRTREIGAISRKTLTQVVHDLADEVFRQLFLTGFFHGDPHPGNVLLRKDGRFVFLDFGIFGDLTLEQRRDFSGFVENLAFGRFRESAHSYSRLCILGSDTAMDEWIYDVSRALAAWSDGVRDPEAPLEQRHMGGLQGRIASAMRRHDVRTRPNQLLVWRALVMLDTTTLRLPVDFQLLEVLTSFFARTRGNPRTLAGKLAHEWVSEAPEIARRALPASRRLLGVAPEARPRVEISAALTGRRRSRFVANTTAAAAALVLLMSMPHHGAAMAVSVVSLILTAGTLRK